jgi:hypothetical protein
MKTASRRRPFRPRPGALPAFLFCLACAACSTEENGGPRKPGAEPAPERAVERTAAQAYQALRDEILQGNFIALYDACSARYRKEKFAPERFRTIVASLPGLKAAELTAENVAKMDARELVQTYFRVLPAESKKEIALAMAAVKVLGVQTLPDGRRAIAIDSSGTRSRLLWVLENGAWKMDGEETAPRPR